MNRLAALLMVWATTTTAVAGPTSQPARPLSASIPAEALVVYFNRPGAQVRSRAQAAAGMASVLLAASTLGVLPAEGGFLADLVGCLPVVGTHDLAVVLLHVSSRQVGPHSYRLEQLKLALLVRTKGQNEPITAQIRRILSRHTNSSVAELEQVSVGQDSFRRLTDSRLPPWQVLTFGALDDLYVITMGSSAHRQILDAHRSRTGSLAKNEWFARADHATGGDQAGIEWLIDFEKLRSRLGQVVRGRPEAVLKELGFDTVRRGLWSISSTPRGQAWCGMHLTADGDRLRVLSDPDTFPDRHRQAVPAGANHAMIRMDVAATSRALARAYLASRSDQRAARLRQAWRRVQAELELDIETDLLEQLGPYVIIHDRPPHPLNIPFACTVLIQLRDRAGVQATLDTLLSAWDAHLVARSEGIGRALFAPRIRHDADGVWYIQVGLAGPALCVTDRYLLISWSPHAVRANLELLSQIPDGGTTKPGANQAGR